MGCGGSKKEPEPEPEPEPTPPSAVNMKRRGSAAAQGNLNPADFKINLNTLPKVVKDDAALARIEACVTKNFLCGHLSQEYRAAVISSMKEVTVAKGETIIKQGDVGDFWYIVDQGSFEVWKTQAGEKEPTKVFAYGVGDSFGELALMFNQRRAATVTATADSVLWAVDQHTFQAVVKTAASEQPRVDEAKPPAA